MTFTTDQKSLLEAKLDPSHVKPPQQFGPKGDYLEGWHVIAEANRIFGFDGWSYEVVDVKCVSEAPRKIGRQQKDGWGVTYTARVKAIVSGVIREDCGAGHGYDVDAGLAHESAIKEAVTDALKRAMRTFGNPFGLALYDKTRANVGTTEEEAEKPKQEPRQKASSAEQRRGLEDIERDLLDCTTVQKINACANAWKHIFERDGWTDDFITIARDKFKARIAQIKQAEAEDIFPGDQKDAA